MSKKKKLNKTSKIAIPLILSIIIVAAVGALYMAGKNVSVLNPQGSIAQGQYDLIVFTSLLSLIIVIPVFAMTFYIVWKYRASNTKANYQPDMDSNRVAETIWWVIPLILITILGAIIWKSSHDLDPYKPLESDKKPLTVQVVALQWKWLFIYPEQNIASVDYLRIPEDRPINFQITADAPMNSFWIPQLGGQVYAMSGMSTKLHLMASNPGMYRGVSANLSGEGFADMDFKTQAVTEKEFDAWAASVRPPKSLDMTEYTKLAEPSRDNPEAVYSLADKKLYDNVIMKYMMPSNQADEGAEHVPGMKTEHGH